MLSLPWAQNNSLIFFILLVAAIYFLKELLILQLRRKRFLFYALLYPGVILHELGHLVGCKLSGAKVCSVKFVSSQGGEVVHENSKIPVVGNFIISVFPLAFGIILIYFIVLLVKSNFPDLSGMASWTVKILGYYLIIAILLTMFPSFQDIKNALLIYLLIIAGTILIVIKTNWGIPLFLNITLYFCAFCLVVVNLIMLISLTLQRKKY